MNLGKLRTARTVALTLLGFALIVAGAWTVMAHLFGTVIGSGTGLALSGLALLVIEGLSAGPGDR